ncbi:MAG: UDP-N-acetylglucosamine 2-epimerase (non-hydrolyzing) [bacterium]|nr:UDP-N-acetylglucosamine 2-epimerase (non-hydrolyzing) [bacterium]
MKKIISVVGARPNFMKVAPLHKAFRRYSDRITHLICHTGQHYDKKMSKVFFEDLELPHPDFYLGVGSGSHAQQTAKVMVEFEKILLKEQPDLVLVVGDVNSTIACSLTAIKLHISVGHVEAGLRSFDRKMPEEINRLLTDQIADYLFVTEKSGLENLANEGAPKKKVFFVGNVMIDSLANYLPKIKQSGILQNLGRKIEPSKYTLATFHRPSNVDSNEFLTPLIDFLNDISGKEGTGSPVIFPVHPRTLKNMEKFGLKEKIGKNIVLIEPLGYIDFQALVKQAGLIVTDSGGIQEESTYLGVQCITVRDSTERPVTVDIGTNHLAGTDLNKAKSMALDILKGQLKDGQIPELWDGKAAERITEILVEKI